MLLEARAFGTWTRATPAGAVAVEGGSRGQRCSASKGREETLLLSLPNLRFPAGLPVG